MALFRRTRPDERADRDPDSSPFTQPGFIASAALMALVLVFVLIVVIDDARSSGGDPAASTSGATGPLPTSTRGANGADAPADSTNGPAATPTGDCPRLPATDSSIPTSAPERVTWKEFRTVMLPSSPAGPAVLGPGIARCFARTPTGALMAAAQLTVQYVASLNWLGVAEHSILPGRGRDTYLENRQTALADRGVRIRVTPGTYRQIAGFRFINYSPDSARIQIIRSSSDGTLVGGVHTLVWHAGDWKLQLLADGSDASVVQRNDSLGEYVTWVAT